MDITAHRLVDAEDNETHFYFFFKKMRLSYEVAKKQNFGPPDLSVPLKVMQDYPYENCYLMQDVFDDVFRED